LKAGRWWRIQGLALPKLGSEVLYVMHNSDKNDDEGNVTKILHSSSTVPAYLLGTSKVAKADVGFCHVTHDLVSVEKTNTPNTESDAGRHHLPVTASNTVLNKPSKLNDPTTRTPQTCSSRTRAYPTGSCGDSRLCSRVDPCINTRHSTQRSRVESSTSRNPPPQHTPSRL
jgi:hypothetical protein